MFTKWKLHDIFISKIFEFFIAKIMEIRPESTFDERRKKLSPFMLEVQMFLFFNRPFGNIKLVNKILKWAEDKINIIPIIYFFHDQDIDNQPRTRDS